MYNCDVYILWQFKSDFYYRIAGNFARGKISPISPVVLSGENLTGNFFPLMKAISRRLCQVNQVSS